jgi:hypothetical protein
MTASLRLIRNWSVTALLVGCSPGWHRVTPSPSETLKTRQQFQVWTHGEAYQWHGLRVTSDSVSGVPFTKPPMCDSCRVHLARAEVDSVRAGDPVGGLWGGGLLIGLALGLVGYAIVWGLHALYPAT